MSHEQKNLRQLFEESLRDPNINTRPFATPGAPAQEKYNSLYQWEVYGTVMGPYITPLEYSSWWEESLALRNTAMLGDWSFLAKYRVTGPDAPRFVNYLSTKDLTRQSVDQVYFTPMVDENGKVAMEGLLFRLGEREYLFTDGPPIQWFRKVRELSGMNVEIEDVTPDYSVYQLQGPRCFDILETMTRQNFHDLRFSRGRWIHYKGFDLYVSRQGVTGELGFELMAPVEGARAQSAVVLWDDLARAGKDFGLRMVGNKARRIGHIEAGIPTRRYDYTRAIPSGDAAADGFDKAKFAAEKALADLDKSSQYATPGELGWQYLVDLQGADFYGRQALLREAEAGGPLRRLTGLIWNGSDVADLYAGLFRDEQAPWPPPLPRQQQPLWLRILNEGAFVGWATSPTYSPNLRRMISFGRVDKEFAVAGTELIVEYCDPGGRTRELRSNVTLLPFIAHQRSRDVSGEKSILE